MKSRKKESMKNELHVDVILDEKPSILKCISSFFIFFPSQELEKYLKRIMFEKSRSQIMGRKKVSYSSSYQLRHMIIQQSEFDILYSNKDILGILFWGKKWTKDIPIMDC